MKEILTSDMTVPILVALFMPFDAVLILRLQVNLNKASIYLQRE